MQQLRASSRLMEQGHAKIHPPGMAGEIQAVRGLNSGLGIFRPLAPMDSNTPPSLGISRLLFVVMASYAFFGAFATVKLFGGPLVQLDRNIRAQEAGWGGGALGQVPGTRSRNTRGLDLALPGCPVWRPISRVGTCQVTL